ncbi:MAG: hypothetical protein K8T89_17135 [Planctomycetes bacterium]|nr:hypothetical protein [Planctomycetota bacterium]
MYKLPNIPERKPNAGPRGEDGFRRNGKRMVLCLGQLTQAAVIERFFQERGWSVRLAKTEQEARTLARDSASCVVLLAEENAESESGWLTCWKLLSDKPNAKVIVLGDQAPDQGSRMAGFVGAMAYVAAKDSAAGISRVLQTFSDSVI